MVGSKYTWKSEVKRSNIQKQEKKVKIKYMASKSESVSHGIQKYVSNKNEAKDS